MPKTVKRPSRKKTKPGGSDPDRRRTTRVPLAVPVFARGTDEQGKKFLEFTTTLNLSADGALLVMRQFLPLFTQVSLEIPAAPLPKLRASLTLVRNLQARVIRISPSEPSYLCALRFTHPIMNIG